MDLLNLKPVWWNRSNRFADSLLWFTTTIQDGVVNSNASLMHSTWTSGFVFQRLLQILMIITYLLYIWLSHLKQLMYEQTMWSIHITWPKSFSGLPSHPNSVDNMHFSNNCSRCTMHSNKVLKLLQILLHLGRFGFLKFGSIRFGFESQVPGSVFSVSVFAHHRNEGACSG